MASLVWDRRENGVRMAWDESENGEDGKLIMARWVRMEKFKNSKDGNWKVNNGELSGVHVVEDQCYWIAKYRVAHEKQNIFFIFKVMKLIFGEWWHLSEYKIFPPKILFFKIHGPHLKFFYFLKIISKWWNKLLLLNYIWQHIK